jgi:DNA-binding LytR/AlgR family response regulator
MTCIAVDDETPALYLVEDAIKKVPFLRHIKSCKNAFEAMEILQKETIDLMFLDIEMPGINGIEFLQSLPSRPLVIFTTAYKKYALEGYELDVIDYLLKPFTLDRFLASVNKAAEYHHLKLIDKDSPTRTADTFFVHAEYSLTKIVVSQIAYIESLKDYVKIYLAGEARPVITNLSMRTMEEKLPADKFIRIHRSYIIPLDRIKSIRKNLVHTEDKQFPISEHYREHLFRLIDPQKLT